MYLVQEVKGRSGIRIHAGNVAGRVDMGMKSDFKGCITFGTSRGKLYGQQAVLNTSNSIYLIEKFLDYKDFILNITGEFHE